MNRRTLRNALLPTAAVLVAACHHLPPHEVAAPEPVPRFEAAAWQDLPGWQQDNLAEVAAPLAASCGTARLGAAWKDFCDGAKQAGGDAAALRALIETRLRPYRVATYAGRERRDTGLITGYYEPLLRGSHARGGAFQTPLYGVPPDLVTVDLADLYPELKDKRVRGRLTGKRVVPYPERAQLADGKLLTGHELLWVDSPVDAFFLEIQGSGRVQLDDGTMVRMAFADVNGRPYRAIGRYLVERGELPAEQSSAHALRDWLAAHPERDQEVFNQNPSVVFFREEPLTDPDTGPKGAMGVSLTPQRSLAIDPKWLPLGAPLYLSTTHPLTGMPFQKLMLGQDTGGAIRGAIRADLFWGWGEAAAAAAGSTRQDGAMWLLWPADQPPPEPSAAAPAASAATP